jgi:hypothetical protein
MSIEIEVVAAGPPGPRGYTGNTGPTGPQGAKGDKGDTGNTGAKGDKGDTGNTGAKGDKGDTGNTGAKGDKGDTGAKGDKGDTGNTGAKGDKGDQGDQGVIGPTPSLSIGTVGTGAAAASLTGTSEAPVLNLTLPSAGANGVDTAAIQDSAVTSAKIADGTIATGDIADGAVTPAKLATTGRFTFPTGAANGYGFASGAVHLSGTGSPEGAVTAAPGSTWLQTDATTDVKGWIRWVKATGTGNTGWVRRGPKRTPGGVMSRHSSPATPAPWRTSGVVAMSGGNRQVSFAGGSNGATPVLSGGWNTLLTLPTGFRSFTGLTTPWNAGFGDDIRRGLISNTGAVQFFGAGASVGASAISATYDTQNAWPSSLPGSAA